MIRRASSLAAVVRAHVKMIELKLVTIHGVLEGCRLGLHRRTQLGVRGCDYGVHMVPVQAGVDLDIAEVRRSNANMHLALPHPLQYTRALDAGSGRSIEWLGCRVCRSERRRGHGCAVCHLTRVGALHWM